MVSPRTLPPSLLITGDLDANIFYPSKYFLPGVGGRRPCGPAHPASSQAEAEGHVRAPQARRPPAQLRGLPQEGGLLRLELLNEPSRSFITATFQVSFTADSIHLPILELAKQGHALIR